MATTTQTEQQQQQQQLVVFVQSVSAGIIMHLPGLVVKWQYEDWAQYATSLIGAALEGTLLLLFATRVCYFGYYGYNSMVKKYLPFIERPLPRLPKAFYGAMIALFSFSRKSSLIAVKRTCLLLVASRVFHYGVLHGGNNQQSLPLLLKMSYITVSVLVTTCYISFIITSIVGDATYRTMSGNDTPDGETLRHGSENAKQHMLSQFQADFQGSIFRLSFGCLCLGVSIYVYTWPLRKGFSSSSLTKQTRRILSSWLIFVACILINEGWYQPVLHAYFSLFIEANNNGMANEGITNKLEPMMRSFSGGGGKRPNLIYIQHESLSGSLMLNTEEGRKAMVCSISYLLLICCYFLAHILCSNNWSAILSAHDA